MCKCPSSLGCSCYHSNVTFQWTFFIQMSWAHILMYWTFLGCQRQKMEWWRRCKSKHTWISAIFESQELGFDGWSDAKVSVHFIVQCAPLQTNTKTLFSCTDPQQEAMCAPAHLCTSHCCTHKLLHYTLDSELWTCRTMLCASKCISVRRTSAHYAFLLTMHAHCYHSTLAHLSFKSVPGMAYGRHAGIH